MTTFNIIMVVCCLPIWPIMYFLTRNYAKPKKNIILGATLPHSAHGDSDTQEIIRAFKSQLNLFMLPLLPLIAPPFFMTMGPAMTWYMTWLLVLIVAPFAIFAHYRNKLIALKRERRWYSEADGQTLADVRAAAIPPQKINGLWFLPPIIAAFVPVAYSLLNTADWAFTIIYITFALTAVLFWLCYYLIFRTRLDVFNENLTLTMALRRVRLYKWGKFWLVSTWLTGVLTLLLWVFDNNVTAILITTIVYTILLIAVALYTEFGAREAQQKLTAGCTGKLYVDEDDQWIWGMFYYNPNDNHFLVNDRVGINMTINLAKKGAKTLMIISLALILAMPFIGVWMWVEESVPAGLVLSDTELIARHTRDQYVITLNTIESAELIDELRTTMKLNGANFENLYKGIFQVRDIGTARLCVQPQDPPFLVVTAGGQVYIFNDADSDVTRGIYAQLTRR